MKIYNPTIADVTELSDLVASDGASGGFLQDAQLDTDGTLAGNLDTKLASQKATKTYADTKLSATGTATNDSAAAGKIGEYISSNIATPGSSISSATATNVTTISLTAGDWEVCGNVGFIGAAGTTMTLIAACVSQTTAAFPTAPNGGATAQLAGTLGTAATHILPTGTVRVSLSGTATIYLVGSVTFAVSTATAYGFIGARRVR